MGHRVQHGLIECARCYLGAERHQDLATNVTGLTPRFLHESDRL